MLAVLRWAMWPTRLGICITMGEFIRTGMARPGCEQEYQMVEDNIEPINN